MHMLAIQNIQCENGNSASCCTDNAEGDALFSAVPNNHNFQSNNGPGPWLVAVLDQFDDTRQVNFGAGLWDVAPCPLTNNLDPTNPNSCNPATCTSATVGGLYTDQTYGCYRCDEVARVGYIFSRCTEDASFHKQLRLTDTRQRWEMPAYAACFYREPHVTTEPVPTPQ